MIVFYKHTRFGIRIWNPDPYDIKYPHTTLYVDYSLREAKQRFRKQYELERKHIIWEEI